MSSPNSTSSLESLEPSPITYPESAARRTPSPIPPLPVPPPPLPPAEVILYDQATLYGTICCQPLVWQIRMALKYKKVRYRVVFIEFPDIPERLKELGFVLPKGATMYRVPAIHHVATGTNVMDAVHIIDFLDRLYPQYPIFRSPTGLEEHFRRVLMETYQVFVLSRMIHILEPRSAKAFRTYHENICHHPLEEYMAQEDLYFRSIEGSLKELGEVLLAVRGKKRFLYSDEQPSQLDLLICGTMMAARVIYEPLVLRTLAYPGYHQVLKSCLPYMENDPDEGIDHGV